MTGPELNRRDMCALATATVAIGGLTTACRGGAVAAPRPPGSIVELPAPGSTGTVTLAQALRARRSVRAFTRQTLDIVQVGGLMWATQGVTHDGDRRTAPSAGALYPLELYAVDVEHVLHYLPAGHRAERWASSTARRGLIESVTSHDAIRSAPVAFVITAVVSRSEGRYRDEAATYVAVEAGHAAQNLLLQAIGLGLGAVPMGAMDHDGVAAALSLPPGESALYVIAVGHPAGLRG
jgi:SagB-type dehydrogenase family enzyme